MHKQREFIVRMLCWLVMLPWMDIFHFSILQLAPLLRFFYLLSRHESILYIHENMGLLFRCVCGVWKASTRVCLSIRKHAWSSVVGRRRRRRRMPPPGYLCMTFGSLRL